MTSTHVKVFAQPPPPFDTALETVRPKLDLGLASHDLDDETNFRELRVWRRLAPRQRCMSSKRNNESGDYSCVDPRPAFASGAEA